MGLFARTPYRTPYLTRQSMGPIEPVEQPCDYLQDVIELFEQELEDTEITMLLEHGIQFEKFPLDVYLCRPGQQLPDGILGRVYYTMGTRWAHPASAHYVS